MSLGLALYLLRSGQRHRAALAGLATEAHVASEGETRADGPLVWMHAADDSGAAAVAELAPALRRAGGPAVLRTGVGTAQQLPPDTPAAAARFLDRWQPALAVLAGAALPAALVTEAHRRDIPIFLIDCGGLPHVVGGRWYPGLLRGLLHRVTRVMARDAPRAELFRRLGVPPSRIVVTGRVEPSPRALPCTEAERAALAHGLHSRLVWLAAAVTEEEEEAILAAHGAALRLSHRLLLILVPQDPARGPALAARAEAQGLSVALRSREDYPDDEDQIYVADTEGEYGLWYRLANLCFLGGSLHGPGPLRNPLEAAALGAAILHGPHSGEHAEMLARLDAARAARMVSSVSTLCDVIGELRAPDRVALLAHNAWVVASSGADVTERVARDLREAIAAPRAA
ncbi:3-deoxy-D-manno-octulosonic acid transferase [Plastorhodobacter daqingensis]|uniref:3-deoxy-D-manno-octulosonic acid transferase n=1 Tax=Plastorhodobacter daqingensis TaxID=1387281 RepID=A0ABW2UDY5_9RHOB